MSANAIEETVDDHQSARSARKELYETIRQDTPFKEKARDALALGVHYLGMETGLLTYIEQERNRWKTVVSTDSSGGRFPPGLECDLEQTYCRQIITANTSLTLYDAPNQGWADDPAFESLSVDCYHGVPFSLAGELYGTVCFVSEEPRRERFSEQETMFTELLTRFLERELAYAKRETDALKQANVANVLDRVLRHNLRNDMAAIRGNTRLMAEKLDETTYSETALQKIDGLIELSEKARQLKRVISGGFERTQTDITALIEHAIETVVDEYPDVSVSFEYKCELTAAVSPSFKKALEELLENGAKHGRGNLEVSLEATPELIDIRIADDGPGLSTQEREVLNTGAEKPLTHGSGLGLWLAHWVVSSHDGSVDATVTDEGTTMVVTIPRQPETRVPEQFTELTQVRDKYQAAFERAHDAMVILDDEARIIETNPEATTLYGRKREELLGRQLQEFLPDDLDFEPKWQEFQKVGSHRETVTMTAADGTERTMEYTATANVMPGQHLLIFRNVTDRLEHKKELP